MAPKITCVEDGSVVSLANFDDMICKAFNKQSSHVQFSDEYHVIMDVADVIYDDGKWSDDRYEHVMARLEAACPNKKFIMNLKKYITYFLKDKYTLVY